MGLKILWFSNAPWSQTGYGMQTAQAWWRIQKLGHKVAAIACNYGHEGMPIGFGCNNEETVIWGRGFNAHGVDIIGAHAANSKADIVITLYDTWVFNPSVMQQFKWCSWLPVDHDPCPPAVKQVLQAAYRPIAFSKFGEEKLREAGLDPLYVPHGIETSIFKPGNKAEAREKLGLSKYEFLAVMVAANKGQPSRKSFNEVFAAWTAFVKEHDNALLYCHSNPGTENQGENLEGLAKAHGIPQDNLRFADPYRLLMGYPQEWLARLYQAADVLVSPSMGEGFGVPIVEAQACGCPVIVGNWTSMPELCFGGWTVTGQPKMTPLLAAQWIPSINSIAEALREAYKNKDNEKLRRKALNGAIMYDADTVARNFWKPALAQIEEDLKPKEFAVKGLVFEDNAA